VEVRGGLEGRKWVEGEKVEWRRGVEGKREAEREWRRVQGADEA
jgi:hypothetical protein